MIDENETSIESDWQQLAGHAKAYWEKLTDDDIAAIAGKRDGLRDLIVQRYGTLKEDASAQIDLWLGQLPASLNARVHLAQQNEAGLRPPNVDTRSNKLEDSPQSPPMVSRNRTQAKAQESQQQHLREAQARTAAASVKAEQSLRMPNRTLANAMKTQKKTQGPRQ